MGSEASAILLGLSFLNSSLQLAIDGRRSMQQPLLCYTRRAKINRRTRLPIVPGMLRGGAISKVV